MSISIALKWHIVMSFSGHFLSPEQGHRRSRGRGALPSSLHSGWLSRTYITGGGGRALCLPSCVHRRESLSPGLPMRTQHWENISDSHSLLFALASLPSWWDWTGLDSFPLLNLPELKQGLGSWSASVPYDNCICIRPQGPDLGEGIANQTCLL